METEDIRRQFLAYFHEKKHAIIPSSPVVPHDDPTLLFTNAGMNQFKDVFLGNSHRDYTRAATSQKCVRVGGKHNDLDNVGHTRRHLTFFEMLGNFSFGDYFKADAIAFAWEVSTQVFGFDPERLWPSIFEDDEEAYSLWKKYVPEKRITRFGEKENFWSMGDTGPCGPCSELLYDRGEKYGRAKNPQEDVDGERFLEYWNLVFMQFNRTGDGKMNPLPKPSIDTGAGLERIVSLKMDVDSVFETDILRSIISQIENVSGITYDFHSNLGAAFRVIADHLRCLSFAIGDGVQPSNIDRGYVLRKVLRRAVRYGRLLGMDEPFLAKVFPRLLETMGKDYPELVKGQGRIIEILTTEEEAFLRTLKRGGNILKEVMDKAKKSGNKISGDDAFKLKDTYGLPLDEILLLAKDTDLSVDTARFEELEKEAKERSRSQQKVTQQIATVNLFQDYVKVHGPCQFLGYKEQSSKGKITALVRNGELVNELKEGESGLVVLDQTPFYAEMGGQIGDTGTLKSDTVLFQVTDCIAPYKGVIGHVGSVEKGTLTVGESLLASIDSVRRQKIANNHTATHLLHWALHRVLGEHVKQAGSVVDPDRLRFDFSHHKALSQEEIFAIEDLVNEKIRENKAIKSYEIPYKDAVKETDIKQFFGEKYGTEVRVIDLDYSKELCGGTHTTYTGNIGLFRIAKESSIAAGIRRIEAVTGKDAEELGRKSDLLLEAIGTTLKTQTPKIADRLDKLIEENKQLALDVKKAKKIEIKNIGQALLTKVETINNIPLLLAEVALPPEDLKELTEEIMAIKPSLVLVLGAGVADRCSVLIRVGEDLQQKGIKASELIGLVGPLIEGSGGGKPGNAQAGGKAPKNIGKALDKVREWVQCFKI